MRALASVCARALNEVHVYMRVYDVCVTRCVNYDGILCSQSRNAQNPGAESLLTCTTSDSPKSNTEHSVPSFCTTMKLPGLTGGKLSCSVKCSVTINTCILFSTPTSVYVYKIYSVSFGWLSVCMLLGDVGDTDIHKQHDAAMMEMRACIHNLT